MQALLGAGLPGAVSVVALSFGYLCFRELMAAHARAVTHHEAATAQIVAAHEKRADDAKAALRDATKALSESAAASEAQARALAEVREALRDGERGR